MLKTISKSFKFRLLTTPVQSKIFASWAGTCRFLFNLGLEHRILSWSNYRLNVSYVDQANCLKEMKKVEGFEWISQTPAQLLQQSFKDLDRAFKNFFQLGRGFPSFKKKYQKDSFRFPDPKQFKIKKISKRCGAVFLPKIGIVKFINSRKIEGRIRNATVSKSGGHWDISFNCELEINVPQNEGPALGIDRGVVKTLAFSDGTTHQIPEKIKNLENRISVLQKRMSLKKKFSKNWNKFKRKLAAIHGTLSRIREDWLHKISHSITKNHSYVVIEDLKIKNMTRSAKGTLIEPGKNVAAKSGLNKAILRQGWHKFGVFLNYKCGWYGGHLDVVEPHYTSLECSQCGHRAKGNRPNQESFHCQSCGYKDNADINAAKTILTRGQRGRVCGGAAHGSFPWEKQLTDEAETTYFASAT